MPVYLFTFHAYRSWKADNPRGYVQEGQGIQPPSASLAQYRDECAAQPEVRFEKTHQEVLIWIAHDACARRGWRLHFAATDPTHVHILLSWRSREPWRNVRKRLKNLAALMLGKKELGRPGRKWLSRKGSRKRVRDREHFDYLVNRYLPSHRGLKWREGDPTPTELFPGAPP
ncbi:MAG: hypothetical protein ACYTG0_19580 [Planctomycetota bacterium]|jgi:REP element-mobilizing transposase RayT